MCLSLPLREKLARLPVLLPAGEPTTTAYVRILFNQWPGELPRPLLAGVFSLLLACCGEDPPPTAPSVSTLQVFDIASNKATVSGQVTSDGGAPILMRGMCWSDTTEPDLHTGDTVTVKPGKGLYFAYLTGLTSGRAYRVRAFAINQVDTAYGRVLEFVAGRGTDGCGLAPVWDIDSNSYPTREIGGYCWMLRNLKVTRYSNGDSIDWGADPAIWLQNARGLQRTYAGQSGYLGTYGRLYNFQAATDPRGVCPTGWRLPTSEEWTTFTTRLEGATQAGGILKSTQFWALPNTGAVDGGGYRALPGGYTDDRGQDVALTYLGYWWSSTAPNSWNATAFGLRHNSGAAFVVELPQQSGLSIRCLKD